MDSGDGPAVFLIFVLGFLVVPLAIWASNVVDLPLWLQGLFWGVVILGLTIGMLRPAKVDRLRAQLSPSRRSGRMTMPAVRFQFRPVPTAIALIGVAILIGLGTWQLYRRTWKENLLATIAARMESAPVAPPAEIADPSAWAFQPVRVTGRFANDHVDRLYGRTYDGAAGVHLLVPLVREGAPPILVDRGFVPFDHASTLAALGVSGGGRAGPRSKA